MDELTTLGLNYNKCPRCGQMALPRTGPCVRCGHRVPVSGPGAPGQIAGYATGPGCGGTTPYTAGQTAAQPAGYPQRMCAQHPAVPAVVTCMVCGSPICQTCDFALAGNTHVCPRCIAQKDKGPTGKRKLLIAATFAIAVWGTLGLVLLFSGALVNASKDKQSEEALGVAIHLLLFIPSLIGLGLSIATFDRRLPNPASLWIAALWNGLIFTVLLILVIIGLVSQA